MGGEVVDVGSRAVGRACKGRPRIDSAARVELRLCFGAVLCCVAYSTVCAVSPLVQSRLSLRCVCVFPVPCTSLYNSGYVYDTTPTCVYHTCGERATKVRIIGWDGTKNRSRKKISNFNLSIVGTRVTRVADWPPDRNGRSSLYEKLKRL